MIFDKHSNLCNIYDFHSNPWPLDPLNPFNIINSFADDSYLLIAKTKQAGFEFTLMLF